MQPPIDISKLSDAEKVSHALKRRQVSIGQIRPNEDFKTIVKFFEDNYHFPASHVRVHINQKLVL